MIVCRDPNNDKANPHKGVAYHFDSDELVSATGYQLLELAKAIGPGVAIESILLTNTAKWTDVPPVLTAIVVTDKVGHLAGLPTTPRRSVAYLYRYLNNGWIFWKETVV